MIPRLIHHTAKTSSVDPKWAPFQKTLLELHPDWSYRLWTDEDNLLLLRERRPDLESVYWGMPMPVMRADMMRYVYMLQFGGLYLDLDYQLLKPFDLGDKIIILPRESNDGQPVYLGNCILASEPGHPFWAALLEEIRRDPPTKEKFRSEQDIIDQTGPGFVTRMWREQFQDDATIFIPPRLWFNPLIPRTEEELKALRSRDESYGIHWCFGSWRDLTVWAKVKRRVRRFLRR
jgi:mannosyltransferase OCH1-like enzyme